MEDLATWLKTEDELRERTGHPIIQYIAHNTLVTTYGEEACKRLINPTTARAKTEGSLLIGLACPGLEHFTTSAANISDIHLKLIRDHGTLLLYGRKPRTCAYAVEIDVSKGYPLPKLTPII